MIDRDRFFVDHDQKMIGDNTDFTWDSRIFGMDNRLAAQLQMSRNWIQFTEEGGNTYPDDCCLGRQPVTRTLWSRIA